MVDDIDKQIVDGVLKIQSECDQTIKTKLKIHRSATQTFYTFYEAGLEGKLCSGNRVSITGTIGDDKLPFSSPEVHIEQVNVNSDGRFFIARPLEGSHIGTYGSECVSISREVNAQLPSLQDIPIGPYLCSCKQVPVRKLTRLLSDVSKQTNVYRSELTLSGPTQAKAVYDKEACSILRLFGVMVSSSLFTRRTRYQFDDTGQVDHHWFNASAGVGKSEVVQDADSFLLSTYSTWNSLNPKIREAIELASTYIATSSEGFLDTRLFSLFQAWELLAKAYVKEYKTEWNEVQALDEDARSALELSLKSAYERWQDEYPESNHNDIANIGNIIGKAQQITAKGAVDFLVQRTELKPEKLEFNINKLKNISNYVRHTGKLKAQDQYGDDLDLYVETRFALQIIIFRILGYERKVWHHIDKFRSCEPMIFYFGTAEEYAAHEETERLETERLFDKLK